MAELRAGGMKMGGLLITGFTGFIGRHLVKRLDSSKYDQVYCLSRHARPTATSLSHRAIFQVIPGTILNPKDYASHLGSVDTVIHLAAATGKRPAAEYFAVNTEGTRILLEECLRAGVRRFLHVSSIAVKYRDKSRYYYAQSKELAECAVKQWGIAYTIVRPTIVIGADSPIWQSLSRLGRSPITPIFGTGKNLIQPIYIDDLVDCLLLILDQDMFLNDTVELGGPEKITLEEFLAAAHSAYHGKKPRTVHLPLTPLFCSLSILESSFYSILPITVGQLAAFYNDSTIEENELFQQRKPHMRRVKEMLMLVREDERQHAGDPHS